MSTDNNEYIQEVQPVEEMNEVEPQTAPEKKPETVTISSNEYQALKRIADKKTQKPETLQTPEKSQPTGINQDSLIDNFTLVKDFSPDELATIRKEAKDLGADTFKFIQSNVGKVYIEKLRSTKQAEDSTLAPSNKGFSYAGKPFKDVINGGDKKEAQAAWESRIASIGKRGSSSI